MRFQRKGWESLSDAYRRRLERGGVTRQGYESGASLGKARGHTPKRRGGPVGPVSFPPLSVDELADWIEKMRDLYRIPEYVIRQDIAAMSSDRLRDVVRLQNRMEEAYHEDRYAEATAIWETRDDSVPDWMNRYHSWFN